MEHIPCLWIRRLNIIKMSNFLKKERKYPDSFFKATNTMILGFPGASVVKNPRVMQKTQETQVLSLSRKVPWRKAWQPTPVFLPGDSHGQRSLAGYSPQVHKESDMTKATEHTCTMMPKSDKEKKNTDQYPNTPQRGLQSQCNC